jgi:hypothetical protein
VIKILCPELTQSPQCETHHGTAVNSAGGARIDVFDGRLRIFQMGLFEQSYQLAITAAVDLAIDQECQMLFETHRRHARLRELFFQAGCQAVEFQGAQLRQRGMHHHDGNPYW